MNTKYKQINNMETSVVYENKATGNTILYRYKMFFSARIWNTK